MGDDTLHQLLKVLGQAAVPTESGERALHDPAARLHGKPRLLGWSADDGDAPVQVLLDPVLEAALVRPVGPQLLQPGELAVGTGQQVQAPIPILFVSRMDVNAQDQPVGVDQQVALAARDLSPPPS